MGGAERSCHAVISWSGSGAVDEDCLIVATAIVVDADLLVTNAPMFGQVQPP